MKSSSLLSSSSSSSSNPGKKFSSCSLIESFSISKPGIFIASSSSSSSNPGTVTSSSKSSISIWGTFSTTFLGLPLFFLGCSSFSSDAAFFLGLPLLFGFASSCGSSCSSTFLVIFSTDISSTSGSIFFCFVVVSLSGTKSSKPSICTSVVCGCTCFCGFGFDNFLFFSKLTALGTTTGFDKMSSFTLGFNSFSLVPDLSSPFVLNLSETFALNAITCWYLGDFSSKTALTFKGKNLQITFNCISLYCAAILLKLSIYLSSFFPSLL